MTAIINNYSKPRYFIVIKSTANHYKMRVDILVKTYEGYIYFEEIFEERLAKKGVIEPFKSPIFFDGNTFSDLQYCIVFLFESRKEAGKYLESYINNEEQKDSKYIKYEVLETMERKTEYVDTA